VNFNAWLATDQGFNKNNLCWGKLTAWPKVQQPQRPFAQAESSKQQKRRIKPAAIFRKLSLVRHLKMLSTADAISIGLITRNARIARAQQFDRRDRSAPEQKRTQHERL
jgi:hypothetical protein